MEISCHAIHPGGFGLVLGWQSGNQGGTHGVWVEESNGTVREGKSGSLGSSRKPSERGRRDLTEGLRLLGTA